MLDAGCWMLDADNMVLAIVGIQKKELTPIFLNHKTSKKPIKISRDQLLTPQFSHTINLFTYRD